MANFIPVNPVLVCGSPHVMRIHTTRCINLTQVDWLKITDDELFERIRRSAEGYTDLHIMHVPLQDFSETMPLVARVTACVQRLGRSVNVTCSADPPKTPFVFEQLPKEIADVFCNLNDPFQKIPTCSFGGAACAITTPVMSMRVISDEDQETMRAYFGTPERKGRPVLMGVSYFVRDALYAHFGIMVNPETNVPFRHIDPMEMAKMLGLDVPVHLFVPASPRSDPDATVYFNKSMYSVQHVMMVTTPWRGALLA